LELNASETAKLAELAPIVEGKPDVTKIAQINLERLAREFRTQRIIFETARDVYDQRQKDWKGSKEYLLSQLVRLVEQFIRSDRISIIPTLFSQDDLPEEPGDVAHHLFSPREPRRMAEGGRVGELPHQIIGDQRLPLRGVLDEGLEMAVQELGGDRHRSLLVDLGKVLMRYRL
jgi:hypothetical protein